jgi:hypothetical protein
MNLLACAAINKFSDMTERFIKKQAFYISLKLMEQHAFKNVNNCLNSNIYSYLETSVACTINM